MKQEIFKLKYIEKLKGEIDHTMFLGREFIFDNKQVLLLPNTEKPIGLLSKLKPNSDFDSAIEIYEAYKTLAPIQASDERLWTYLSLVDLFPYMTARWDSVIDKTAKDNKKYILDHWFLPSTSQGSLLRHAIAGLWWAVYLSIDEVRGQNKYELTEILFRQIGFPTRTLGMYKLGRHKEAVIGILEFIKENPDLFNNKFEEKSRYITKYLNLLGGVKLITSLDRNFYKNELTLISDKISNI